MKYAPLAAAAAAAWLLLSNPAVASGTAYRCVLYPVAGNEGSSGDREAGANGAFWIPSSAYDDPTGGWKPIVHRLESSGNVAKWELDPAARSFFPVAVRWHAAGGRAIVLVPLSTEQRALVYALDPATGGATRTEVPFLARSLRLDPLDGSPWIVGRDTVARLSGGTLRTWTIPGVVEAAGRFDASGRLWLATEGGVLLSLTRDGALAGWGPGSSPGTLLTVDESGTELWGVDGARDRLVRFRPSTGERTAWPQVRPVSNWAGLAVSGGAVALAASYGPHVLSGAVAELAGGTTAVQTSAPANAGTPTDAPAPAVAVTPTRSDSTASSTARTLQAPVDSGRALFTTSGEAYRALLWAGAGTFLVATDGVELWTPLAAGAPFTTRQVLPVAVEVRPNDPTRNFFTEVAVSNLDAERDVVLTLTTAGATHTLPIDLPAGTTRVLPNVVQSFRDLGGASLPPGETVAGTLAAQFRNGSGSLSARVFTRFPDGSTTGLGFTSLDAAREARVFRKTLNGLKNTAGFRTNVAVANLCGLEGSCPTLDVSADFFDDATGTAVGTATLQVPPGQWKQVDAPLAAFPGAVGETFSVVFVPFSAEATAYDAYATVVSNANQDAAFVRASPAERASNLTLPVITDAGGIGTRFTSELALTNTTGGPATADVTFTSAKSGNVVAETLQLAPGLGVLWPNAVGHFRSISPASVQADDYGPVRIAFRDFASGFASVRTTATNGTGLGFTAIDPYVERAKRTKRIVGLVENARFRTNLAVVHAGATGAEPSATMTLRVTVRDAEGAVVGAPLERTLGPGQLHQWTKVLSEFLGRTGEGYTATIERIDGLDPFDAYVTVIDNASTDPVFVRAE
ncbi:MAG: NHL repeat-containing protein [Thermoanaerobaculia bacterium]